MVGMDQNARVAVAAAVATIGAGLYCSFLLRGATSSTAGKERDHTQKQKQKRKNKKQKKQKKNNSTHSKTSTVRPLKTQTAENTSIWSPSWQKQQSDSGSKVAEPDSIPEPFLEAADVDADALMEAAEAAALMEAAESAALMVAAEAAAHTSTPPMLPIDAPLEADCAGTELPRPAVPTDTDRRPAPLTPHQEALVQAAERAQGEGGASPVHGAYAAVLQGDSPPLARPKSTTAASPAPRLSLPRRTPQTLAELGGGECGTQILASHWHPTATARPAWRARVAEPVALLGAHPQAHLVRPARRCPCAVRQCLPTPLGHAAHLTTSRGVAFNRE
jgi:hypothetical protein